MDPPSQVPVACLRRPVIMNLIEAELAPYHHPADWRYRALGMDGAQKQRLAPGYRALKEGRVRNGAALTESGAQWRSCDVQHIGAPLN